MKRREFIGLMGGAAAWPAAARAQSESLTKLSPKGELRAALIVSNPVLVTRGADGQPGGVSVEIARALATKLGVSIRLMSYDNPARYNESLGKDEWDIGLAARDPSRGEHLAFSDVFMEVDNGYVARPGLSLKTVDEVDRAGIKIAVVQGSAPDGFLTRTIKHAEIVRIPGGLAPAREVLATGRADVYGENVHLASRIAAELPGAVVLDGRFNLVQMSIAVPKHNAAALPIVNEFVREAKQGGLVTRLIVGAITRCTSRALGRLLDPDQTLALIDRPKFAHARCSIQPDGAKGMPFAINQGVRIHYETIGNGPALVMLHGTSGSGADWVDLGYVDAFKADQQVILIDSRGHGQSDKPHDPRAYDPALRVSDALAVLDELHIQKSDYLGYSLGGWIGFGLAKRAPERFRSFIFGGSHPYAENMQQFRDCMPRSRDAFAAIVDQVFGSRLTSAMRTRLLANDLDALRALTQDRESNVDVLPLMTMPCLLFAGELDPRFAQVRRCTSDLSNATFFSLPECDHAAAALSDLVIPHLKTFLTKVHN